MNLPSFLWLWRIAAWSMGITLLLYVLLGLSGGWFFLSRSQKAKRPRWLRPAHLGMGVALVVAIGLLLTIGIVGTLGHFGSLGHSPHLWAGLTVVGLVLSSATSAKLISPKRPWARPVHVSLNGLLLLALLFVTLSGWKVVQKYLPGGKENPQIAVTDLKGGRVVCDTSFSEKWSYTG